MVKIDSSFKEREQRAIEAALRGKPILDFLLPFRTITISSYCNDKNTAIGAMLDGLSGSHYEWYGYSLAEKRNLALIVDTLIQPGQFVTGYDVDFKPIDAKRAMDELYHLNTLEARLGTGIELVPVGIVHRHGFSRGIPSRSDKDVKNLSDYVHWMASATEVLSPHPGEFDQVGRFNIHVNGNTIWLAALSADDVSLFYDLGDAEKEEGFLAKLGIDPKTLQAVGGFRGLLQKHLEQIGGMRAEQNRYVSTATSIIYNQDGSQRFGEIIVLAKGAVNGTYEHSFEVNVNVADSGGGKEVSLESLTEEVDKKIAWAKKSMVVSYPTGTQVVRTHESAGLIGERGAEVWREYWPDTGVVMAKKDSGQSDIERAANFYYTSCLYMNNCRDPNAKYSVYLFSVLYQMQSKNMPLADAICSVGNLFEDPLNENGEFLKPPFEVLNPALITPRVYSKKLGIRRLEEDIVSQFTGNTLHFLNRVMERYVPLIITANPGRGKANG